MLAHRREHELLAARAREGAVGIGRHPPADLAVIALRPLRKHLEWRPATNRFVRFGERFAQDLPKLREAGLDRHHACAFASEDRQAPLSN